MRLDAGAILKRFHFLERALVRACAAWIPSVHLLEAKALLARTAWESSLTADAARERVFELRFPSRLIELGPDEALVRLYESAVQAPSSSAFLEGLASVYLTSLRNAQSAYLAASDVLADGPSRRFLEVSVAEKCRQIEELAKTAAAEQAASGVAGKNGDWTRELQRVAGALGSIGLEPLRAIDLDRVIPRRKAYAVPADPARDERYFRCSFYWPDILDPGYSYGSGLRLQIRSAVSHLNEVWAVETAGAALVELFDELGWEFVLDAARWTWDEARHMLMGQRRLEAWRLDPVNIPLGKYIYEACNEGGDPIYRLGMLGLFETKNIGKKRVRAREFGSMGDPMSDRDMQFDWADETMHAEYGRRWLKQLLEARGRAPEAYVTILADCEGLVAQRVARAQPDELAAIRACAEALLAEAERRADISDRPRRCD